MLEILTRIVNNEGTLADLDMLETLSQTITQTALCGLGQAACNPVVSTLHHFRNEYLAHVVDHHCPICNGPKAHLAIDPEKCKGCGKCKKNCPMGAISGEKKKPHTIDTAKCIRCGDCIRVCNELQGMGILDFAYRGSNVQVMPAFDRKLSQTHCISCGQCAAVCLTGAITIRNQITEAWKALHDPQLRVVIQIAPAGRVALGEAFGLRPGENVLDKLVASLKLMGADEIYDTTFAADMTVMEETAEFLRRLEAGGPFPMFTSCYPAWIRYLEHEDPKHISTCKSPMEMFAAILRAKPETDGRKLYHIAIMPCTAKKMEAGRKEFTHDGQPDVDLVLTTQEVIQLIQEAGIRFNNLPGEAPDRPFGLGAGAGVIFGTTGGVAEAVARRVMADESRNTLQAIAYSGLRGSGAIRAAELHVGDKTIRVGVVHGLANAKRLIAQMEAGEYPNGPECRLKGNA